MGESQILKEVFLRLCTLLALNKYITYKKERLC
jgi:hypothetical protein